MLSSWIASSCCSCQGQQSIIIINPILVPNTHDGRNSSSRFCSYTTKAVSAAHHHHHHHQARGDKRIKLFKRKEEEEEEESKTGMKSKVAAVAVLAAGVVTLGMGWAVGDASAAKSGGRIGGQSFRSSQPTPPPRVRNNNSSRTSRTNIYVNPPPVAPPLVGGYGYGGWWGWSPFSFFAPPPPSVAVGVGGGFDSLTLFLFLGAGAALLRRFTRSFRDRDADDD